ncbi:hypothetical protein Q8W40_09265 [Vibrio penaeicida]|uniref:hypothetical protein n=1 Tax=Vibrio penaeicida TaxID=104609 RepID=UPI0027340C07|nr:hypothetical protein [Vibrio penaeicida]MDP2572368.1 hypothetical protein [Vibrio penaeicida]
MATGKPSSNRISDDTKLHVLKLISEYYLDFGPTLVHEKLTEVHGFNISLETLRQWMIADALGFHIPKENLELINFVIAETA